MKDETPGKKQMPPMVDISSMSEDNRIHLIGNWVMETRESVWCMTDDEPKKPERYKKKLRERFPLLILGDEIKRNFPTEGCAGFKVYPPVQN